MKRRSRVAALVVAFFLAAAAIAMLLGMAWMTHRATEFERSPGGQPAADEAGGRGEDEGGVDWAYWKDINPDIIGWVTVPGTGIDYPIVQAHADDPGYYLDHDVYGEWNYHGAPYLTWECADGGLLGSGNALVFGHHLNDGTMFSALANFSRPGYAEGHAPIVVQTPEATAELTVLAVDVVDASRESTRVEFRDDSDRAGWLTETIAGADLDLASDGFDPSDVGGVVTLCTCSYNRWGNERTLVVCEATGAYAPVSDAQVQR